MTITTYSKNSLQLAVKNFKLSTLGAKIAIIVINIYISVISPFLPRSCRFTPTCSEYAREALKQFGFFKGIWLGTKRIIRCHPWNPGGYDPVPGTHEKG